MSPLTLLKPLTAQVIPQAVHSTAIRQCQAEWILRRVDLHLPESSLELLLPMACATALFQLVQIFSVPMELTGSVKKSSSG